MNAPPSQHLIERAVAVALDEDLGLAGDITSQACIPVDTSSHAVIRARQTGRLSGLAMAREAFRQIDPQVEFATEKEDGDALSGGDVIARISGRARSILAAERVALNYLGRLSGIATAAAAFVEKTRGASAQICCTRKTMPGMRAFEKHAVACGGGANHRFGLFDAILIKDNHIAAAGGVSAALKAAKATAGHLVKVEIEVDTLEQLDEAIDAGADAVLLDNMSTEQLSQAVARAPKHVKLEASGGVTLGTVAAIAKTGVDYISVGAITHSAPNFDFGLDFE